MDLLDLIVKDKESKEYTFVPEGDCILEIHYSTSYFQFVVQEKYIEDEKVKYKTKDLIYILKDANPIDLLAINEDEICSMSMIPRFVSCKYCCSKINTRNDIYYYLDLVSGHSRTYCCEKCSEFKNKKVFKKHDKRDVG